MMYTSYGDMEADIPRDSKEEFEPQVIKEYWNKLIRYMEKIISMYVKGMTATDIESETMKESL